MRVKEEAVGAPGKGLGAAVEVVVRRRFGELAAVLLLLVLEMRSVLSLNVTHPGEDGNSYGNQLALRT